jgi:DNA-directed RNA polymerase subunit N
MGESPKDVLDSLKLERYCCRKMLLTHANLIDEVAPYT